MVLVDEVYGGNYINAATLKSERLVNKLLTISGAGTMEIGQGEKSKNKIALSFKEIEKRLILNKTNAAILSESFGNETDEWIEKKIKLNITKVNFQGSIVDGIGVMLG